MKVKCLPLILILSLISCTANKAESQLKPTQSASISTEILNPQPIEIKLEDLPPPFSSDSASKPPQILPIPSPRIFNLPEGFTVNVYAEGLNNPRWLALTPEGNVLVTETRDNRITLLQDTDNDGVADRTSVFADKSNGLNIPFPKNIVMVLLSLFVAHGIVMRERVINWCLYLLMNKVILKVIMRIF